jgi:putative nucleotidyltransferase with HDIG domain
MYSKNGHIRILLIEDNKDDEELIRIALQRRAGYRVIINRVETEAGLRLALEDATWDIVLCDYLMPNFSAEMALSIVREEVDDIPFIILSGYEDEPTALRMLKIGAHDFVYKKNLERLAIAVQRELKQAGERMIGRLEIERSYMLTIQAWGIALERRDIHTADHTIRVTDLTLRLARSLGVSGDQFRSIHYGALLHDVGKMGIPDSILLKPDTLLPEEMDIIKLHPKIAFEMLSDIKFLESSINIPYCHHERFDGTGYPRGGGDEHTKKTDRMIGENIPIEARIFSICDVYDALTNERPYRKPWSKEKALEYIKSESGKSFDPAIVDKFIEVMRS